ncbi:MAG: GNAT family N-acetyltransferase [gamma proteobacterium symbiont of Bathyaustriella thionipta]|nr:GNAT family N-acetyltransferase [gamma proteobacterium symbiont of Bathyaustriella thionipta]MCU7949981.1 GNAT family N-acetyltransferase [gamma proteobacterium symbiont of Bathyaustriella thionipta]MCU7954769.1 GNAT family N-acetyltransferase [gamma proteobacterium symbiont of Bathyaustriella thionipta]MCU7956559.1 GNAT family N-acetyltransferase [gamma proteobacterium symbiont of Bathyaustriella thionipta]MCU7967550.1 GNAT family N-acetyltransferase [gamma proteobacterium symbiont of Bathy
MKQTTHTTHSLTFRSVVKSDLSEILRFPLNEIELFYFSPSVHFPLTIEQLETQLSTRHESTVMLENNQVVGFANFYNVKNYQIAFIGNVIIKPEKRRQGLGKKLILMMIARGFKELQLKEIHLSCFQENTVALLFYKQLGFKTYAEETRLNAENQAMSLLHLKIKKTDSR